MAACARTVRGEATPAIAASAAVMTVLRSIIAALHQREPDPVTIADRTRDRLSTSRYGHRYDGDAGGVVEEQLRLAFIEKEGVVDHCGVVMEAGVGNWLMPAAF
jgi:hypothetical protein